MALHPPFPPDDGSPPPTRVASCLASSFIALMVAAAAAPADEPGSIGEVIETRFGDDLDRRLFRADVGISTGRWDATGRGLRATIPGGAGRRAPILLRGEFSLEGDFEIVVDYTIARLPAPGPDAAPADGAEGGSGLGVLLWLPGRRISLTRGRWGRGEAVRYFGVDGAGGAFSGSSPAAVSSGRLGVRRIGETVTFHRGDASGRLTEVGSALVGAQPVRGMAVQAMADGSGPRDALDLRLDGLSVRADRIVRHARQPARGVAFTPVAGAAMLGLAALFWMARGGRVAVARPSPTVGRRGFTLIELLVTTSIIALLVGLLLPAIRSARESARRVECQNNLKQIGLALAGYESACSSYPFGVGGAGPPGREPRWSALSQVLPYLEHGPLYNAINFDGTPWLHDPLYGPANQTALATVVAGFLCPSDSDAIDDPGGTAHNTYRANAGTLPYNLSADLPLPGGTGRNDGIFWFQSATRAADIRDGLSRTAALSERCLGNPVEPDQAADYYLVGGTIDACRRASPDATPRFANAHEWSGQRWGDGNVLYTRYHHILPPGSNSCLLGGSGDFDGPALVSASSRHPGGVNYLTADGSVRFARRGVAPPVWRALGTAAGGEVVGDGDY